jgi:hypothetical protein
MRRVNYARRQQRRRLRRAVAPASGCGATGLLALVIASAGAMSLAACLLILALGLGLYARHWALLAGRSRVGARSEDQVQRVERDVLVVSIDQLIASLRSATQVSRRAA